MSSWYEIHYSHRLSAFYVVRCISREVKSRFWPFIRKYKRIETTYCPIVEEVPRSEPMFHTTTKLKTFPIYAQAEIWIKRTVDNELEHRTRIFTDERCAEGCLSTPVNDYIKCVCGHPIIDGKCSPTYIPNGTSDVVHVRHPCKN